jgi:predicted transcriptional regulator with HTH domain
MQSLDLLKPNKSFVTIENESLIAGVVTNQVHPSRLLSRNYLVPSVVDAFQSLHSVHLLLVGESGIVLATVHSVIKSDMSRVHGCAEKRYLVPVNRRRSRVHGIGLGLVNCEGKPAKVRSWKMQQEFIYA